MDLHQKLSLEGGLSRARHKNLATVVAGVLTGNCQLDTKVTLPGGDLDISWDRDGSGKIFMTGPAEPTFKGEFLV